MAEIAESHPPSTKDRFNDCNVLWSAVSLVWPLYWPCVLSPALMLLQIQVNIRCPLLSGLFHQLEGYMLDFLYCPITCFCSLLSHVDMKLHSVCLGLFAGNSSDVLLWFITICWLSPLTFLLSTHFSPEESQILFFTTQSNHSKVRIFKWKLFAGSKSGFEQNVRIFIPHGGFAYTTSQNLSKWVPFFSYNHITKLVSGRK